MRNLGEYYDLYVYSNWSLLAVVFNNYGSMCIEIYELDPARFFSLQKLALVFKKANRIIKFNQKARLNLSIDINTELRRKSKNDFEKSFLTND